MRKRPLVTGGLLLALAPMTIVACGDDDDSGDGGAEVSAVLGEFKVELDPTSVEAGAITFEVDNQGSETHELVVVRAATAEELPTAADGSFDEAAFGEDKVLGEVEDVASNSTDSLTLDLEADSYVLLCNLVEEEESGETESHFAEGMYTTFTVG